MAEAAVLAAIGDRLEPGIARSWLRRSVKDHPSAWAICRAHRERESRSSDGDPAASATFAEADHAAALASLTPAERWLWDMTGLDLGGWQGLLDELPNDERFRWLSLGIDPADR